MVWDGLDSPPWKTVKEPELRAFLLARAAEGYSFPINPVWPVRDPGWLEVLHALQQHEESVANLSSWFPPESGVLESIESLHATHPNGFFVKPETKRSGSVFSRLEGGGDVDIRDMANFADLEVRKEIKARWRRIRMALKAQVLKQAKE